MQTKGIATITAAQLLITAGDTPERIASETAFTMLPIPASSDHTTHPRLNRGDDTAANSAPHRIALARLATNPDTPAHTAKHTTEGKNKKDILRYLKRTIAREVFHLITHPQPVQSTTDLRPTRRQPGLTITDVANTLRYDITKISRIQRDHTRDTRFPHEYHDRLTSQQPLRTTA